MISVTKLLFAREYFGDSLRYTKTAHSMRNGAGEGMGPVVVWNSTKTCNLKCIHCYMKSDAQKYKNELTTDEAKKFIGDEPFMFYLSDNILLGSLKTMVDEFNQGAHDCMLALSRVPDPERFGIPYFDDAGALVDVVEKPSNPPNNLAVTGIYLYAGKIFFDAFDRIAKSPRGEYEISSIHSLFLKEKRRVGYTEITGWWKDTGKPEDLLICNALLLDGMDEQAFPRKGTVAPDAQISGNVHIGVGTQVGNGVRIQGPVIIGENCRLENCVIGPYATLGAGVEVRGATIENSLVLDNATITHPIHLRNSLIGKKAQIISRPPSDEQGGMMIVGEKTVVSL
jgi:glucose-1-phosphate thymidylyltransferase